MKLYASGLILKKRLVKRILEQIPLFAPEKLPADLYGGSKGNVQIGDAVP